MDYLGFRTKGLFCGNDLFGAIDVPWTSGGGQDSARAAGGSDHLTVLPCRLDFVSLEASTLIYLYLEMHYLKVLYPVV